MKVLVICFIYLFIYNPCLGGLGLLPVYNEFTFFLISASIAKSYCLRPIYLICLLLIFMKVLVYCAGVCIVQSIFKFCWHYGLLCTY